MSADRRCGTCKHWRPRHQRDALMDRHYGSCLAPLPTRLPASAAIETSDISSIAGDDCPVWKRGGKHGALR